MQEYKNLTKVELLQVRESAVQALGQVEAALAQQDLLTPIVMNIRQGRMNAVRATQYINEKISSLRLDLIERLVIELAGLDTEPMLPDVVKKLVAFNMVDNPFFISVTEGEAIKAIGYLALLCACRKVLHTASVGAVHTNTKQERTNDE